MLSNDLQNMIAEVSATIAAGEQLGRVKLEKLRRNLNAAARDAGRIEREAAVVGGTLADLCDGVDARIVDIAGLARHARAQMPQVQ